MPDQQPFERKQIEHDIERLSRELAEKQQQLSAGETKDQKEVFHELVRETIQRAPAPVAAPAPTTPMPAPSPVAPDDEFPEYLRNVDPGIREHVHALLQIAFVHGIEKAAAEAKKADPFILDAFHDALVDKLYNELKARGLI